MVDRDAPQVEPTPTRSDDADAARARRMHERTGEIELLISGALVFGLFQIPGMLDDLTLGLVPRLSRGQFVAVFMVAFYVRLIVITLMVAFLFHLVTRAYWVGLIGLDSVFPDGIHWKNIKYGPLAKDVYQEEIPGLPLMARRADDVGSSIFSFAFWISVLFVWSILLGAVLGGIWYLVQLLLLPGLDTLWFFVGVLTLAMIPGVAITIDKAFSGRLDPERGFGRVVRGTIRKAYWITGGPIFMPIQFTLFSRVPKKMIWPLFIGVFASLLVGFMGAELWRSGGFRLSASDLYPVRAGPRTMVDRHFADTRAPNSEGPYIQSRVVEGPYVELRAPLVAMRIGSRFETVCPDFETEGRTGVIGDDWRDERADVAYERRLLDCFSSVWIVSLDGTPLDLEWDMEWTTGFGPTGVVAYIPTDGLSPGPHVLEVRELPAPPEEGSDEEAADPTLDYIRFRR